MKRLIFALLAAPVLTGCVAPNPTHPLATSPQAFQYVQQAEQDQLRAQAQRLYDAEKFHVDPDQNLYVGCTQVWLHAAPDAPACAEGESAAVAVSMTGAKTPRRQYDACYTQRDGKVHVRWLDRVPSGASKVTTLRLRLVGEPMQVPPSKCVAPVDPYNHVIVVQH
jgi:hypothetical protein